MASHEAVVQRAKEESERILHEAQEDARRLRLEAEDYADAKLAQLEVVLQKILEDMIELDRRPVAHDRPSGRGPRRSSAARHRAARARCRPAAVRGGREG